MHVHKKGILAPWYNQLMGFRSVLISEDTGLELPNWFMEKHSWWLNFHPKYYLPFSSKIERKEYQHDDLYADLQRVLGGPNTHELPHAREVELVWFHECGGITKVTITPSAVRFLEPTEWLEVDEVMHHYCYGCSKPPPTEEEKLDQRAIDLHGAPRGWREPKR